MKRLLAYLFIVLGLMFSVSAHSKTVTIASWGGAYTESQKLGMGKYAEEKTGIKIKWVNYSGGLSEIRSQIKSGKIKFIQGDWIKDNAVVIDAGYHPEKCGDIDLDQVKERSLAYTPVPGGVGPMTISTLILQTVEACENS